MPRNPETLMINSLTFKISLSKGPPSAALWAVSVGEPSRNVQLEHRSREPLAHPLAGMGKSGTIGRNFETSPTDPSHDNRRRHDQSPRPTRRRRTKEADLARRCHQYSRLAHRAA